MVVQKFGGTSVADPDAIRRLIEIARAARARDGRGPVLVVSAMSGVTDALLALAADAGSGQLDRAQSQIDRLRARHRSAARGLVSAAEAYGLGGQIVRQFAELAAVAKALAVLREVSLRTLDVVAAIGELLSSRIVASALCHAGLPGEWVDARRVIVTDDEHTRAAPLVRETRSALRASVLTLVDAGRVPVVGGFVGATPDGHTTTLGRGGSDYSGALVGAGLDAAEIQIWTDVDGMLTADPRLLPQSRLVPQLSFAEAAELAYFGAKVLHPSTIHPAVERNIPVRILNSRKSDLPGTLITSEPSPALAPVTAMAAKGDVTVVDITSDRMLMAYGFLRRVFEVFERFRTAVDVVTTSEVSVSVTVDDRRHLDAIVEALSEFADVSVEPQMALLCAVGDRLRTDPAIAARVVRVLEEVPLRMISQAASRRNITVILRQSDLPHAMQRLHEEFFT
ncbi:MAG: lysine-sensitive aspartokinase 3 [Acidobacteria bacterium]|nr:lysine-sensitive aspartokinase 3 [Acidobacteriota bacterium]